MFNIDVLRRDIEALIRDNPVLAEDDDLRVDMLEGQTDIKDALRALSRAVKHSEDMAEGARKRLADLKARRDRYDLRVESFRGLILKVLQSANLKKLELPEVTLSQHNQPPQIVGEVDADALPDDLVRIKREADRVAIKQALRDGRVLPGLSLSNAPPTLMIKVK